MLESLKITRRQSQIRQQLAELAAKPEPTEDEVRSMDSLDGEYRTNETRFRAALIAEDTERREAGAELETRSDREWADVASAFELRQVAYHYDENTAFQGQTAEVIQELRSQGGYRGIPVPLEALIETRAGETVAAGAPDPMQTMPIIDRLFAPSVAARMGVATINIGTGEREYPVASSSISAGWTTSETGNVPGPEVFSTVDKALAPDHNYGVQVKLTRKAMKQSGAGLETAMRRDIASAMRVGMDKAVFLGSGASGEPLGVLTGAATYGITETAVDGLPDYAVFRKAVVRFMQANAVASPTEIRALIRPETWDMLEKLAAATSAPMWEWDRLAATLGASNLHMSTNALEAPVGDNFESKAVLMTNAGGLPPAFFATWGAIDMVRDVYTDAASGGLRLTALTTADVTVARGTQTEILTGLRGV